LLNTDVTPVTRFDTLSCHHNAFYHRRNLANNIGGGWGNRPWVLGPLIYEGVELEGGGILDVFLFLEQILEGHLSPLLHPQVMSMLLISFQSPLPVTLYFLLIFVL
jgi:hypothetical protein